jgi:hypothetical protein
LGSAVDGVGAAAGFSCFVAAAFLAEPPAADDDFARCCAFVRAAERALSRDVAAPVALPPVAGAFDDLWPVPAPVPAFGSGVGAATRGGVVVGSWCVGVAGPSLSSETTPTVTTVAAAAPSANALANERSRSPRVGKT